MALRSNRASITYRKSNLLAASIYKADGADIDVAPRCLGLVDDSDSEGGASVGGNVPDSLVHLFVVLASLDEEAFAGVVDEFDVDAFERAAAHRSEEHTS